MSEDDTFEIAGEFDFGEKLASQIFAQKRTSRHKHFTFFDGEHVYKGPYRPEKLGNFIRRCEVLSTINISFPDVKIVFPEEGVFETEIGKFLRFPNVDPDEDRESEPHQESWKGGYSYRVAKRSKVMKVSDAVKIHEWIYEKVPEMTVLLCAFYLANVGDVGLYNILVDIEKRMIYLIDFEENRNGINTDDFFYFSRVPAEKVAERWRKEIDKNHSKIVVLVDQINLDGTEDVINRLSAKKSSSERALEESSDRSIAIPEFQGVWKGTFHSTTFSGLTIDVAKSALQKFIRRCMVDEALQIAFELYQFGCLGPGKAVVSNLCNRLCIIAAEDIGPANLPLVSEVLEELPKLESAEILYELVEKMTKSPKTRICSHYAKTYNVSSVKIGRNYGLEIDLEDRQTDNLASTEFWHEDDVVPDSLKAYGNIFLERIRSSDPNAFVWFQVYMEDSPKYKVKPRGRRMKSDVILWRMLESITATRNNKVYQKMLPLLESAFFNLSEPKAFIRLAVFLAIKGAEKPGPSLDVETKTLGYYLAGKFKPLVCPEWVKDIHTRHQSKTEKTTREFRTIGALVVNEDVRFADPVLKKIYES